MKRLLILLFILFPFTMLAQERPVLDWNFFRNDRPANAPHQALTWYNLSYRYKPLRFEGDQVYLQFEVSLKMDSVRSYFDVNRKRLPDYELLKHEQGHADIGFLYALKLKEAFEKATFSRKDYQQAVRKIFDEVYGQMNAENIRYDSETDHSKNKNGQRNWDQYLKDEIVIRTIK